jgi:hypothetical protein
MIDFGLADLVRFFLNVQPLILLEFEIGHYLERGFARQRLIVLEAEILEAGTPHYRPFLLFHRVLEVLGDQRLHHIAANLLSKAASDYCGRGVAWAKTRDSRFARILCGDRIGLAPYHIGGNLDH